MRLKQFNARKLILQNTIRKQLQKGIAEHGLVETLVWNERTGNLVSGHQRISILDKLERGTDYELTVAAIDVDEREEATLNIQLNNKSMQGDYDFALLGDAVADFGLDFGDLGFDDMDVSMMFGEDTRFAGLFDAPPVEAAKTELKDIKEARKNMNEKYSKEQNADFYFVVVCADQSEKDELLHSMSVPNYEWYVTSAQLRRLMK
jgi:hypothetical protein